MQYSERLEEIRERIEGAARLHHLLRLGFTDRDTHSEMEKLAKKIGAVNLIDRCTASKNIKSKHVAVAIIVGDDGGGCSSGNAEHCVCWPHTVPNYGDNFNKTNPMQSVGTHEMIPRAAADDEEDHSKMSDSGVGSCGRCDVDTKLMRTCSCHSFDESTNKSHHSNDAEEEDCFDNCGKKMLDYQMSTVMPNAHLYSYSMSIELPDMEHINGLTPKMQK